jgi:hypothetical protein
MFGGAQQAGAAAEAGQMSAEQQLMATIAQQQLFEQGMALQEPFRQAGYAGLRAYEAEPQYGFTPEDLYRLQENQAALQRVYSAQGKRKSGQAARGQAGLFEQATADAYNRDYQRLLGAGQVGAQAAGLGAGQAMQTGQGIASAYMQGARNQIPYLQMQGQLGASNIAALSNLGGSLANYWQSQPAKVGEDFLYGEEF